MRAGLIGCLGLTLLAGPAQAEPTGTVVVKLEGLRSDAGQVIVALYTTEDGFPLNLDKAPFLVKASVSQGAATVRVPGVRLGQVAVAGIHDENGNNTLDTYIIGIPKEGVACSNNAHGRFGPPEFSDAALSFSADGQVVVMKMAYL